MDVKQDAEVPSSAPRWLKIGLPAAGLALLITWLALTPEGLLGKMDAIGCAVCHRIEERSFFLGERSLPLCARCSGMFLGALVGLLYQNRLGKQSGLPRRRYWLLFGAFFLFYALDGANSYLSLLTPSLYEPHNALRLSSGLLVGVAISAMLLPIMRQALLVETSTEALLNSWKPIAAMLFICAGLFLLFFSDNPFLLYPLAIFSALGVWVLLGSAYTIILQMVLPHAVTYPSLREAWLPLLGGFSLALLQILVTDLLRLAMTGNWNGLVIQ